MKMNQIHTLFTKLLSSLTVWTLISIGSPAMGALWELPSPPRSCGSLTVQLLLLDVSGSVRTIFPELIQQLTSYIQAGNQCTLILLSTFGTTADLQAIAYIDTPQGQQKLLETLNTLQANDDHTNFDEAAKHIEQIRLMLSQAYPELPVRLSIQVLSDDIPDPSPNKADVDFDFKAFMEQVQGDTLQLITLTPTGSTQPTPNDLSGDTVELTTSVNGLATLLEQLWPIIVATPLPTPTPTATPTANPSPTPTPTAKPQDKDIQDTPPQIPWTLVALCLAGLGGIGLVLYIRSFTLETAELAPEPEIESVMVIEQELAEGEEARTLNRKHFKIVPDQDILFGSSQDNHYVIQDPSQAPHLFTLTLRSDGNIHISGKDGLQCNKKPVPTQGLDISDPELCVQFQQRQWLIQLHQGTETAMSAADFLAQIHA